mmetsp:Transcript_7538/g.46331  ORF Transcript_7538/g.46331 Transcript_7538/m.46331 type:complete len:291 (+) Transcript_7538:554-1426(+)
MQSLVYYTLHFGSFAWSTRLEGLYAPFVRETRRLTMAWAGGVTLCTSNTDVIAFLRVSLNTIYGPDFNFLERCGGMSDRCAQYFFDEGCFYECDVNAGRFRRHPTCEGGNAWEMHQAPVKASYCDSFYEACKNDLFCTSDSRTFFGCEEGTQCQPIGEIYANGKDLCETMWGDAFKYETNERDAFTWRFEPGQPNPNDLVLLDVSFPDACEGIHNGSMVDDCVASGLLQQNIMRAVRELEVMMDDQSQGSSNAKDIAIAGLVFGLVGFMMGAFLIFMTQCGRGSKGVPSF